MSNRRNARFIQGNSHSTHNAYEVLQDLIFREKGVKCSIRCTPQYVSIRAASYREFVMAKAAITGRVSVEIIQGLRK